MRVDVNNERHIYADEGKVFRRISDAMVFGNELWLGYTYYLAGELLPEPLWELPEHYEEIEEPVTEETVILSDDVSIEEEVPPVETLSPEPEESIPKPRKVTVADYMALEAQVQELKKIIQG